MRLKHKFIDFLHFTIQLNDKKIIKIELQPALQIIHYKIFERIYEINFVFNT